MSNSAAKVMTSMNLDFFCTRYSFTEGQSSFYMDSKRTFTFISFKILSKTVRAWFLEMRFLSAQ